MTTDDKNLPRGKQPSPELEVELPLKEGVDYYWTEDRLFVFTEAYHLKRGHCCGSGCRHCPYGHSAVPKR